MTESIQSKGRMLQGEVISPEKDQTIRVRIDRSVQHPKYQKVIKKSTKLQVHVPKGGVQCKLGDWVQIQECRPISKTKSWILRSVIVEKTG